MKPSRQPSIAFEVRRSPIRWVRPAIEFAVLSAVILVACVSFPVIAALLHV